MKKKILCMLLLAVSLLLIAKELTVKNMFTELKSAYSSEDAAKILKKYAKAEDILTVKTVQSIWFDFNPEEVKKFANEYYGKNKDSIYAAYFYGRQLDDIKKQHKFAVDLIKKHSDNIDAYILLSEIYISSLFENPENNSNKKFILKKYKKDKSKLDFVASKQEVNDFSKIFYLSNMFYDKKYKELNNMLDGNENTSWYDAQLHAMALAGLKKYEKVKQIFEKIAESEKVPKENLDSYLKEKMADVYYLTKNKKAITKLYEKSTKAGEIYNYAIYLANFDNNKKAIKVLQKLKKTDFNAPFELKENKAFEKIKTNKKFVSLVNSLIEKSKINKKAFDFELKDINGKTVKLSDFKGKIVILDFWATWCGPCKMAMPVISKWMENKPKNVEVLSINVWEKNIEDAKKYFNENNFNMKLLFGTKNLSTEYNFKGIPYICVIDKNGNIVFDEIGFNRGLQNNLSYWVDYLNK